MFEGIPIFKSLESLDPQNFKKLIAALTPHIYELKVAE
jgi:hypothetical protein